MVQSPGMRVLSTWQILELVEWDEWGSLKKADKDLFQLIISAGTLFFTEGGSARAALLGIFPEGTKTGDRLRLK
jgi:hypothetical protein